MNSDRRLKPGLTRASLIAALLALGCSDDPLAASTGGLGSGGSSSAGGSAVQPDPPDPMTPPKGRFDASQFPPTDASAIGAWLDAGHYQDWICESEVTPKDAGAPAIHAHGRTSRVCSNQLLAASQTAPFPAGVASVKEVYADQRLIVHAVAAKIADDSAGGKNWFWYEGERLSGFGLGICTGCHSAAGSSDQMPGAGDFVYFKL